MRKSQRVALLVETASVNGRAIFRGVARYTRTHADWSCFFILGFSGAFPVGLLDWKGDGAIVSTDDRQTAWILHKKRLPVVNVSYDLADELPHQLLNDDAAIGRLAAEHFVDRGFGKVHFFGNVSRRLHVRWRWEGLRERMEREKLPCEQFWPELLDYEDWALHRRLSSEWLKSLPKPVAIVAPDDGQARMLTELCRNMHLRVPEDVAILGIDNDPIQCELSNPPLSSVDPRTEVRGHEAAALLTRMMAGEKGPGKPVRIPPSGVVARRSTEVLAIDDAEVLDALHYIRQHASSPITVTDVLNEVPISRRALELRFAKTLGRTPAEEIRRVHIERAKSLLVDSDYSMEFVARDSGFRHAKSLSDIFSRSEGLSPRDYRQRNRRW